MQSFKIVENEKDYATVVPYYIAQIYYIQGKKEEALKYAETKIKGGKSQYYDLEMKQMIGHAYFERKEYDKGLPYLEDYVSKSTAKVRREDLMNCLMLITRPINCNKAIDGFKQLSGKEDSLSQHAMYLAWRCLSENQVKNQMQEMPFFFVLPTAAIKSNRKFPSSNMPNFLMNSVTRMRHLNSLSSFLNDYPNSTYNTEAKDLLVGVLTNTNNYREALALLDGMSNPTPNAKRLYPRILFGRATELINDGRLAEAEALLDKALKDPNNGSVIAIDEFLERRDCLSE